MLVTYSCVYCRKQHRTETDFVTCNYSDWPSFRRHEYSGGVIEEHTHGIVGQHEAKAILVGVVHPLGHPHDVAVGQRRGVLAAVWAIKQHESVHLMMVLEYLRRIHAHTHMHTHTHTPPSLSLSLSLSEVSTMLTLQHSNISMLKQHQANLKRKWTKNKPSATTNKNTHNLIMLDWVLLYVHRNIGLLGTGAQDGHLNFHTASEH